MTEPRQPIRWKIDWSAFSFVLALTLSIITALTAYHSFNRDFDKELSRIERDVAILNQQVADLREEARERRRRPGED